MITVKLSIGIAEVLSLDDVGTLAALHLRVKFTTRHVYVTGTPEALHTLAEECAHRRSGAWDQPLAWARSAAAAEKRIRTALETTHD